MCRKSWIEFCSLHELRLGRPRKTLISDERGARRLRLSEQAAAALYFGAAGSAGSATTAVR
jgi:hypothetical protein